MQKYKISANRRRKDVKILNNRAISVQSDTELRIISLCEGSHNNLFSNNGPLMGRFLPIIFMLKSTKVGVFPGTFNKIPSNLKKKLKNGLKFPV